MIYTITLNPALDKTVEINNFCPGEVNRISSLRLDAGGKGINVSKVIKTLGEESIALGLLAGRTGGFIKDYLDKENIKNDFVFIDGETRTNLKIIDTVNYINTDINEPAPEVSIEQLNKVADSLFKRLTKEDIVVFSGSVPSPSYRNIYSEWISEVNLRGAKAILDAEGESLRLGIMAAPFLIKPNIHELEGMLDIKIEGFEDAIKHGKELLSYGVKIVALSLGSDGAVFIDNNNTILAKGIKVEVKSTVGAGDSMVAALAYSLHSGLSLEETVKLSVATATANVTTSGTQPAAYETIMELKKRVYI